jgi:hypothetical protein
MTKSHPMHRKKSIHMKFRRTFRVKRLFYRVNTLLDTIATRKKVKQDDQ